MQQRYKTLLATGLLTAIAFTAQAQCPAGEVSVEINVLTDDYGNETYWQLVPTGNACGTGTIYSGGNPALDCTSAGSQTSPAGGYGNNTTISTGPWCLTEGAAFDIISIDSYGDGQATFQVFVEGGVVGTFNAAGGLNVWTFNALPPQEFDLGVSRLTTSIYSEVGTSVEVHGTLFNHGSATVDSYTLNYRIDGGATVSQNITGAGLASGTERSFVHAVPWTPNNVGSVELDVWASDLNGQPDQAPANDVRTALLVVNPAIPDIIEQYLDAPPTLTVVADDDEDLLVPRDLDFHPDRDRNELWVINKDVAQSGGSTVRFFEPGEAEMSFLWQRDPNAWHFMSLPTAIAMGDNGNFATSPGIFDANQNGGDALHRSHALEQRPCDLRAEPVRPARQSLGHAARESAQPGHRARPLEPLLGGGRPCRRRGDERLPRGPRSGPELPWRCADPSLRCLQHHTRPERPRGIALRAGQEHGLVVRRGPRWTARVAHGYAYWDQCGAPLRSVRGRAMLSTPCVTEL
jgi:hypothetical protein